MDMSTLIDKQPPWYVGPQMTPSQKWPNITMHLWQYVEVLGVKWIQHTKNGMGWLG